jgi:alkanesulfonate monooxygenase SsuD/methylene tetrahydromethanopterin reductase-like flavin-dependent oxidoreductase (luciferase family)
MVIELGVQTARGYSASLELARWAESEDLAAFAVADHVLAGQGRTEPAYDQLTLLGGIARETERIRLASLVSPITFRHPALMLKAAVTLDEMSGGRFSLGVGTGWWEDEHRAFGIHLPGWGERFERLEQALSYLQAGLAGAPTGFEGTYYRLEAFGPRPLPTGLELVVGGSGARRTPDLAGRFADEYNVFPSERGTIAEKVESARRVARDAGRDDARIRISTAFPPLTGRTETEFRSNLEEAASRRGVSPEDLSTRFERLGIPIGPPARLTNGVARLQNQGVERIYLQVAGMTLGDVKAAVEAFRT